jgi:TonB family protein
MIAAWMAYATVVGGLLGAGGVALERIARMHSLPSRWIWLLCLFVSVAWPVAQLRWEPRSHPAAPAPVAEPLPAAPTQLSVVPLEPVTMEVGADSVLRRLDGPILAGWSLASGVLALSFLLLCVRTHRLRRGWRRGEVGGEAVLLSNGCGPAVVGFLRPEIVLPRWCEDLDDRTLRFVLDHELEHIEAGDLRLLIVAGAVPVLFPWCLPVWWQLSRLRSAVEGDCDLRVLRRHPGRTRPYIELLLEVGQRRSLPGPLAAMLSEPYETLERRIRIMTMPCPTRPWIRGGTLAGIAAVLATMACGAPAPTDARDEGDDASAAIESMSGAGTVREGPTPPTFTPFSVRPEIRNREEVAAVLGRAYGTLRDGSGIAGTANVWLYVDEDGRAEDVRLNESTGHRALDAAAMGMADVVELTPALNRDQPRAVWVSLAIAFTDGDPREAGGRDGSEVERVGNPFVVESTPFAGAGDAETGAVTGSIRHAVTHQPIADAQIFVRGSGRGSLSNAEGRFRIDHVPVGEQEVVAHLIGYGEARMAVSVAPGASSGADFRLQEAVITLDPLIVR